MQPWTISTSTNRRSRLRRRMAQVAVTGALIAAPVGVLASTASAQTPVTEAAATDISGPAPQAPWADQDRHDHDHPHSDQHRPAPPEVNPPRPEIFPGIPAPATGSAG